jgi:hypothetical protein
MKLLVLTAIASTTLVGGKTLSTKYTTEHALKVAFESSSTTEMTTMEMEIDGEPAPNRGGGGGGKTEMTREEVHVDRVLEATDGKPTKMRRTFEKVGGTMTNARGDNDFSSPFQGITVELERAKDGISSSVVEGKAPDADKALEGQQLELFIDGLLPKGDVDVDATWDLDKDAIVRALRLDVQRNMYPPPERPSDGGGGGRGGGGGGGRRGGGMGGGMMGGGGGMDKYDWKGTAKLTSLDKEVEGVKCAVVELKLEASGEREMPAFGGGGPRPKKDMLELASALENTSTYSVTLEGKLYFDVKDRRPVKLDLEGHTKTESKMESTQNDHSRKSHFVSEGKLTYKVEVSEETAAAAEAGAKKETKGSK